MNRDRMQSLPQFYTQPIGSLPRPQVVLDLVGRRDTIDPDSYRATMDDMVRFAIRLQEQAGLDVVSDGEWRRSHYIGEFLHRVGGCERSRQYQHQGETKFTDVFVRRMDEHDPVFGDDARFLVANTDRRTKYALPSPFLIAIRYWHEDYSRDAYPTYVDLMDDLTQALRREAEAIVEAGVDVVQLDDPALTYFCDRELMAREGTHDERLRRQWDPDNEIPRAVDAINRIAEGLEAEVHLHCCHSVYKRRSDVRGDYKPLLPRFEALAVDRVNLEFAYQGTGAVDDLALLPSHLGVGMGVVDVRSEALQEVDQMVSLVAAATQIISAERIALNPDCGFAPDAGEPPSIDEAFVKLQRLASAAAELRVQSK